MDIVCYILNYQRFQRDIAFSSCCALKPKSLTHITLPGSEAPLHWFQRHLELSICICEMRQVNMTIIFASGTVGNYFTQKQNFPKRWYDTVMPVFTKQKRSRVT